jgi:hypothetical protein
MHPEDVAHVLHVAVAEALAKWLHPDLFATSIRPALWR